MPPKRNNKKKGKGKGKKKSPVAADAAVTDGTPGREAERTGGGRAARNTRSVIAGGSPHGPPSQPGGSPSGSSAARSATASSSPGTLVLSNLTNSPKKEVFGPEKPASSGIHPVLRLADTGLPVDLIMKNAELSAMYAKGLLCYNENFLAEAMQGPHPSVSVMLNRLFLERPYRQFYADMIRQVEYSQLLINTILGRDTHTNGYSPDDTASTTLIEALRNGTPEFRKFFWGIENGPRRLKIKHCWLAWYGKDGRHPFHRDGRYRGKYRMIISLGCLEKEMWFQLGNSMCGIKLGHGSVVTMDSNGGGFTSHMSHGTRKTGQSMLIGLELDEE